MRAARALSLHVHFQARVRRRRQRRGGAIADGFGGRRCRLQLGAEIQIRQLRFGRRGFGFRPGEHIALRLFRNVAEDVRLAELRTAFGGRFDRAVTGHARTGRYQLADDDVLFQTEQRIVLALDRRLGEHPGSLLERGRRQERLGCKRRLRHTQQHRVRLGGLLAASDSLGIFFQELLRVEHLAGQHTRAAAVGDLLLAQHAAHDDFDMLVVDVDALAAVDLLHFLHEVVLQRSLALDAQDVVRVDRAFDELIARFHVLAVAHGHVHVERDLVDVFLAFRIGDHDFANTFLFLNVNGTRLFRDDGLPFGLARFEKFFHTRQAGDDVFGRHAARMEGSQRQLRARFTDALGRDDAHRFADVDYTAGGQITAIADGAHAHARVAGEHRTNRHVFDARRDDASGDVLVDLLTALDDDVAGIVRIGDVLQRVAADDAVDQRLDDLSAFGDVTNHDAALGVAIFLADDHVLCDVDQAPGQVARVCGAQRGVGQAFARAMRRDEVLEHREAFFEVGLDGNAQNAARRIGHQAAHARDLLDLRDRAARARGRHHEDGVEPVLLLEHRLGDFFAGLGPDVDRLRVLFVVGQQAGLVELVDLGDLVVGLFDQRCFLLGDDDVADRHGRARDGGKAEAERLDRVQEACGLRVAVVPVAIGDERGEAFLIDRLVDERMVPFEREGGVEDDAADRRLDDLAAAPAHLDRFVQGNHSRVVRELRFLVVTERAAGGFAVLAPDGGHRARGGRVDGEVIQAQHHVLSRNGDGVAIGWLQDVVAGQHQDARFGLRACRQRQMHRHLVAVEVRVVRRAHERMDLDRFAFHQHRFECLNAEPVQRGSAVEQYRMVLDDLVQHVPNFRPHALHHALRALDVVRLTAVDQFLHHERLEEFERHFFGQAALVQLEIRADHDDRAAGIVDALAEQVLPEAALFAFQNIRERLQRAVVRPGHRPAAAAVVDERIDRFLQHALFVLDDDFGSRQLQQPLQPVVAVDDAAVEIVEIRGRKTAAVELHHGAQFGRNDRHARQDHPFRLVAGMQEGFDHFQPLDRLDPFLAGRLLEIFAQLGLQLVQVEVAQQLADGFGAHARTERVAVFFAVLAIFLLGEDLALLKRRSAGIDDDVGGEINDLLELARRHVEQDADAAGHALEIPDVRHRRGKLDVAHAFAAYLGARDLHAATVADHAFEADALVLAAVAFPVFGRAEDLLAEQTVTLGFERAVVDGLRLFDFAERPRANLLRAREPDAHCIKIIDV